MIVENFTPITQPTSYPVIDLDNLVQADEWINPFAEGGGDSEEHHEAVEGQLQAKFAEFAECLQQSESRSREQKLVSSEKSGEIKTLIKKNEEEGEHGSIMTEMGRRPCCSKEGLNRGSWSAQEDRLLADYIKVHGEGKWRDLPQRAGLKRCGKSCRLRWLNYLRPDIKRGNISQDEEELIIRLHKLLGNRWSLIAGRLPGRTDNEIRNYWNTNLSRRPQENKISKHDKKQEISSKEEIERDQSAHKVFIPKAIRCNMAILPRYIENNLHSGNKGPISPPLMLQKDNNSLEMFMDFDISEFLLLEPLNSSSENQKENIMKDKCEENVVEYHSQRTAYNYINFPNSTVLDAKLMEDDTMLENWVSASNGWDLSNVANFLEL